MSYRNGVCALCGLITGLGCLIVGALALYPEARAGNEALAYACGVSSGLRLGMMRWDEKTEDAACRSYRLNAVNQGLSSMAHPQEVMRHDTQ